MNVVLIGMKHCGKTAIGRILAAHRKARFFNVDEQIEATHACDTNHWLPVDRIFSECGEKHFRRIERMVVCNLYMQMEHPNSTSVLALGSRTALDTGIRDLFGGISLIVYLRLKPEEALARIQRFETPPPGDHEAPHEDFITLYHRHAPLYEQLADLIVDIDGMPPATAVSHLEQCIEKHPLDR